MVVPRAIKVWGETLSQEVLEVSDVAVREEERQRDKQERKAEAKRIKEARRTQSMELRKNRGLRVLEKKPYG